ncbi:MAG: hypothetical protein OXG97_11555 [Candidatus Poribacteria bacterium]|nr:hypothetical protein [Candidatus Poribacteria bacterium]
MKKNLRDKFRDFLASEEGRVGVKAPLAVGIAGGSLLLAQTILPNAAQAHMECQDDGDCDAGKRCDKWIEDEWSAGVNDWVEVWHSSCVN